MSCDGNAALQVQLSYVSARGAWTVEVERSRKSVLGKCDCASLRKIAHEFASMRLWARYSFTMAYNLDSRCNTSDGDCFRRIVWVRFRCGCVVGDFLASGWYNGCRFRNVRHFEFVNEPLTYRFESDVSKPLSHRTARSESANGKKNPGLST